MNTSRTVVKNNIAFKAYYDAKMVECQTRYNVLGQYNVSEKLVSVIRKMLTDVVEFNLE